MTADRSLIEAGELVIEYDGTRENLTTGATRALEALASLSRIGTAPSKRQRIAAHAAALLAELEWGDYDPRGYAPAGYYDPETGPDGEVRDHDDPRPVPGDPLALLPVEDRRVIGLALDDATDELDHRIARGDYADDDPPNGLARENLDAMLAVQQRLSAVQDEARELNDAAADPEPDPAALMRRDLAALAAPPDPAPLPERRPNGTPNGFFLTLRDGVPYCLVHEAPVGDWGGPGFASESEAIGFIDEARAWYARPDGPTRCLFTHPAGGRELTPAERGQRRKVVRPTAQARERRRRNATYLIASSGAPLPIHMLKQEQPAGSRTWCDEIVKGRHHRPSLAMALVSRLCRDCLSAYDRATQGERDALAAGTIDA